MTPKTLDKFADLLQRLMNEHDPPLDIMGLSDGIHTSYEHARKMVRGILVPSPFVIRALAELFAVPESDLVHAANQDKIERKFGGDKSMLIHPEVVPFASAWPMLSEEHKTALLTLLKKSVAESAKKLGRK